MSKYIIWLHKDKGVMALTTQNIQHKIDQLKNTDYCVRIVDIASSIPYVKEQRLKDIEKEINGLRKSVFELRSWIRNLEDEVFKIKNSK